MEHLILLHHANDRYDSSLGVRVLDAVGLTQANSLSERLQRFARGRLNGVYFLSSPAEQAVQTARIVAAGLGVDTVATDARLETLDNVPPSADVIGSVDRLVDRSGVAAMVLVSHYQMVRVYGEHVLRHRLGLVKPLGGVPGKGGGVYFDLVGNRFLAFSPE